MTGDAEFLDDATVAAEGHASVRVTPRSTRAASVSIVPPASAADRGTRVWLRALARRTKAAGSVFAVIEWTNGAGRIIRRAASRPVDAAAGAWGELRVSARAPARAAYARVELVVRGATSPVWFDGLSFGR
jgi:hypothetical protein